MLSIFDSINEIIYVADPETYEILYANKTLKDAFGKDMVGGICYKEFQGRDAPCEFCTNEIILKEKGKPYLWEHHNHVVNRDYMITDRIIQWPDGRDVRFELAIDITLRKKLEAELQKTEKIESLGILAGGIAHDFNNILTVIAGNLSLAKMYARPGYEIFDILTEAEAATLRAKALTQQLLTFSKGGEPVKRPAFVRKLIKDSCSLALKGTDVKCGFTIQKDLLPLNIDEGLISHAINNIIINALQAMPEGGTIQVSAENTTIGAEDALPLTEGKYVKISIKDHGIGIPKEYLSKIFDPFFATEQKDSGLGLTSTYSIIKKHDGHITVESEPGKGTTFHIYLPASKEQVPLNEVAEYFPLTGKGRILVMDDEEPLRTVVSRMLRQCGYEVETAKDGSEMLKIYKDRKEQGQPFDVVIIDLIIPEGMGGKEAIKKLLETDPDAKAVVSSGYSDELVIANFKGFGFRDILLKPYNLNELRRVMQKLTG